MANCCTTTYAFVGAKKDCERLRDTLQDIIDKYDGDVRYLNVLGGKDSITTFDDVTEILKDREKIKTMLWPYGGTIEEVRDVTKVAGKYRIDFDNTDNWQPMRFMAIAIANRLNLSANWIAAETGMNLFEKYDPDKLWTDLKWYVDCFSAPSDFISESDLHVRDTFPEAFWAFLENRSIELSSDTVVHAAALFNASIREPNGDDGEDTVYIHEIEELTSTADM